MASKKGSTSKKGFPKVTHVLFDLDGLMLNTEPVYEQVYTVLATRFGKEYTKEIRLSHVGNADVDTAKKLVQLLELPVTPEEFLKEIREELLERLTNCDLMPGFDRLHAHLEKTKVPTALATSSTQEWLELKTKHLPEAMGRFRHVVAGGSDSEVKNCKPAPDIFLVAASRFPDKPPPNKVLVFEDAVSGVQAALAAGMSVVAVPDPTMPGQHFEIATQVLESLADFKPEDFGLPKY